jgi:hypothetical protein
MMRGMIRGSEWRRYRAALTQDYRTIGRPSSHIAGMAVVPSSSTKPRTIFAPTAYPMSGLTSGQGIAQSGGIALSQGRAASEGLA